jgi:hypothetical protein
LVRGSGNPGNLDIVFLYDGVTDSEFESALANQVNGLFSVDTYAKYSDRISIWKVKGDYRLGCLGWPPQCDESSMNQVVSKCKNGADKMVVIVKNYGNGACFADQDLNNPKHVVVDYSYPPLTTAHELGHCLFRLYDEYLATTSLDYTPKRPNCDVQGCPTWQGTAGTGCYQNCTAPNWYRPTENDCIMLGLRPDGSVINHFDPVDKPVAESILGSYQTMSQASSPQNFLAVTLNNRNGIISTKAVHVITGNLKVISRGDYKINLKSSDGSLISSTNFYPPNGFYYDSFGNSKQWKGGFQKVDDIDFSLVVPYNENVNNVEIFSNQQKTYSSLLSEFARQGKFFMTTSEGEKQIKLSPKDAIQGLELDISKQVNLTEEEGIPIYFIDGVKQVKFLFIIPVSMEIQAKINAENGRVISFNQPWWNFLTS